MHLERRILITGGSGFLGSHLCERLLQDGAQVLCVGARHSGKHRDYGCRGDSLKSRRYLPVPPWKAQTRRYAAQLSGNGLCFAFSLPMRTQQPTDSNQALQKDPDDWKTGDEPMTPAQRSYLETLAQDTGETVEDTLTKAEASKRIDELRERSPRVSGEGS